MSLRLAVIHWSPVEMYPPAVNLVRLLAADRRIALEFHTTEAHRGGGSVSIDGVKILRSPSPVGKSVVPRIWAYLRFHLGTVARLLRQRPATVLYIEPSSAFPVWALSWLRPRTRIFIHHHEYHSPDQFERPGMRLIRWFHRLERGRLFPRAEWISHTNAKRLELFRQDCPEVSGVACRSLPNHPPASWQNGVNEAWLAGVRPFRFVYAGSLSLRDTFLSEFVDWLRTLPPGTAMCDVYAYNLDAETAAFLESPSTTNAGVKWINGGVPYDELPAVLRRYHAGLILYKAETLNYRYNETNKLFEYLACGLDVWYSDRMEGIHSHASETGRPRIVPCDFSTMSVAGLEARMNGSAESSWREVPSAERTLQSLIDAIMEGDF